MSLIVRLKLGSELGLKSTLSIDELWHVQQKQLDLTELLQKTLKIL